MHTLVSKTDRQEIRKRLKNLSPATKPVWGSMTSLQMLAHVALQLESALSITQVERMPGSWFYRPFRKLIIYIFPWPHNLPTTPSWKNPKTKDWDYEMNRFYQLVEKFSETDRPIEWGVHPLLGKLSRKDWGCLSYRHIDHHFRQFAL